ncbi:hypothetical protein ACFLRQ_02000 [Bacteroidota bacterium]
MNKLKYIIVFTLLCLLTVLNGQEISKHSRSDEEAYKFRVKQLSEFIDIFNNEADLVSRGLTVEEIETITREALLKSLFNLSDPRLMPGSDGYSNEYSQAAKEFITQTCKQELNLSKSSEKIFAVASSIGTFRNKPVNFDIILQQELVGRDMLKWVISDVDAPFLEFLLHDTINLRFLPPSSDELDFIELRRALNDVDYLDQYASRDYTYNPLSVFFYLLNNSDVKIESVLEVKYFLGDIPGWRIELSDFNRKTMNSGWLISDLRVSKDED